MLRKFRILQAGHLGHNEGGVGSTRGMICVQRRKLGLIVHPKEFDFYFLHSEEPVKGDLKKSGVKKIYLRWKILKGPDWR